jgi:hypothetical protein
MCVVIDCAGLVARLGDGSVVELSVLEAALDAIELK